jgi:hypothetical protein
MKQTVTHGTVKENKEIITMQENVTNQRTAYSNGKCLRRGKYSYLKVTAINICSRNAGIDQGRY